MRILKILLSLLLVIIIGATVYYYPRLPILTGYAAKMACSCTYISKESPETIASQDLNFFPISLAEVSFDNVNRKTTASLFGLKPMTAQYRQGIGCALSNDKKDSKNVFFNKPNSSYKELDTIAFPYGNKDLIYLTNGTNEEALNEAFTLAFDQDDSFEKRTRALLVLHKDSLIKEAYAPGFDKESSLLGWSMTKSICNTLYGIMVKDGKISIEDKAPIASWQEDERKNISIHDLLQMQSGLQWNEDYFNWSDVTAMLYTEPSVYESAIKNPAEYAAGTHWYYSSGTTNILSGILRKQFNKPEDYLAFPEERLFNPLGINAQMETDIEGNYILSSYGFMTARDWSKLGLLYLNDGVWNGERLLPEGWVKYSTTPASNASNGIYGAQIWLNTNGAMFDKAPHDMFYFSGFQGQYVFVIPSKNLVIVRIGLSYQRELINEVIGGIVDAVGNDRMSE
jgi:CubicO group peptidase (beta-lactamase class C family)